MKFLASDSSFFSDVSEDLKNSFPEITVKTPDLNSSESEGKIIVTHDGLEPGKVVDSLLKSGHSHLVQKNKQHYSDDLKMTAEILENPKKYFENVGAILMKDCHESCEISFSGAQDKANLKAEVQKFLQKVESQNVIESVEVILEELYMNCVLDAPREAQKKNHKIKNYQDGVSAKARLFLNSDRLVLSCEDPFGSLDIMKFVNRMNEVYKKGAGEVLNFNIREGGAGLGCVLMFEQCSHLFLGVESKKRTVVSVIIPVGLSYRQRANEKKSLHLIQIQEHI